MLLSFSPGTTGCSGTL